MHIHALCSEQVSEAFLDDSLLLFFLLELPVQMRKMQPEDVAHRNAACRRRDTDGVRLAVRWTPRTRPNISVKGRVAVSEDDMTTVIVQSDSRSGDVACLRECIHQSDGDCTLGRGPREGIAEPCVEDDEPGE